MKIEYILVVILALGALAFLGTSFLTLGEDAQGGKDNAIEIIDNVGSGGLD
ncbi:hypothetical protein [Actibacterium mucosum]|uniref:hypothetical protein n=1 Tax=Actibacterium mucosum TaxID=1087332 RepID=UPI001376F807|nr:hypothetical protein [Actibacterium mucosum]